MLAEASKRTNVIAERCAIESPREPGSCAESDLTAGIIAAQAHGVWSTLIRLSIPAFCNNLT
jgi:hypothetical protein